MIVIKQSCIYREDLRNNPDILYIFGDNLDRIGNGGQAKEMRGERNSFGIATKRSISHNYPKDYFFDNQPDVIPILKKEFYSLRYWISSTKPKAIVIPTNGIGTGLSKLPIFAPKALEYINRNLKELETL